MRRKFLFIIAVLIALALVRLIAEVIWHKMDSISIIFGIASCGIIDLLYFVIVGKKR